MLSRISYGRDSSVARVRVARPARTVPSDFLIFCGGLSKPFGVLLEGAFRLPLTWMGVRGMASGCSLSLLVPILSPCEELAERLSRTSKGQHRQYRHTRC